MHRRLFTIPAVLSLLLCIAAGVAYICTMTPAWYYVLLFPSAPPKTVPSLKWLCAFFAGTTLALLLKRASHIRLADHRARNGFCRQCGYDLRATIGRCPECGGGGKDKKV
jgi:hypothetical protein